MTYSPSFLKTFRKEVLNIYSILFILISSLIYFSFAILIPNYRLITSTLSGNSQLDFKLNLIFQLIIGSSSSFSVLDFSLLIVSSLLVGLNLLFISKFMVALKSLGLKLGVSVGGSTILGIVVAGCTSCGLSVLSLLGLAAALTIIPFGAMGLHFISILFLLFSLLYSIHNYHNKVVCKIN